MEKIILGIDPGTNILGYGLIKVEGNKFSVITLGVIELNKIKDTYLKLQKIFNRLNGLIEEFCPDEMALEAPFFGKNVQSMLKLGRAQGVAMAAGLVHEVPITEYAPRKIKLAITGNGAATKEQVASMLSKMVKIDEKPEYLDATDALAVAVCHHFQTSKKTISEVTTHKKQQHSRKASQSWSEFIAHNADRVVKKNNEQ